ncbi:PRC-barrel domain-containing protein [Egbenema bharatensis]|uniref:PRC-barrel domain-containing protein n=1 Tax=Egbenema bharatensis TaxID=3463334 RepID=UPI003A8A92C0
MSANSITRQSDFIGRLVLDRQTAESLGRVAELWLDPKAHQIIGLSCKAGLLGTQRHSFTWSQIESIGEDSIMVSALEGVNAEKPESAISQIAQDIWTDSGSQMGGLIDYRFDPETGDVIDYIFVFNGWRGIADSGYCFPPVAVISMHPKRVIVAEAATQNPERFTGRLDQGIASIKDFLKSDYARTQEDIQTIANRLQGITRKTTAQLKDALPHAGQLQAAPDRTTDELDELDELDKPGANAELALDQTVPQDGLLQDSPIATPEADPEPLMAEPIQNTTQDTAQDTTHDKILNSIQDKIQDATPDSGNSH